MNTERRTTPHFQVGRAGRVPAGVVVHTTDGTFEGAASWFASPDSGVSSHYLVGLDGKVASFVDEGNTAHHCGQVAEPTSELGREEDPNLVTIGIEFEDGGDPLGVSRPDAQYRSGARLLREIAGRWGIPLDRQHVVGHREIFSRKACPGNLDIDRLLEEARTQALLVCLLPVRNGAEDLPGYLASVRGFADAVVALDDGSTDDTRAILDADPLVKFVLSNPRRESARGWDDAENRLRLLQAAEDLSATWIVSLDVDERIDADDAGALRSFLTSDALPGLAYGLQLYRMWGDRCDPDYRYVYRLFAYEPDQTFPPERLHFNPVPEQIPRQGWVRTTIRIRHLGASNDERVSAALRKYQEVDPIGEFPHEGAIEPPRKLVEWTPRSADPPVLAPAPRNRLVCLLPVRNGSADLPGYFDSARRVADAIVALDDGSTDDTRVLLDSEPLVKIVLANMPRDTHAGWDDAANRTRLLNAAGVLDPEWVLWLDADERIDEADAAALRRFIENDAVPGYAYLMRVLRVSGEGYVSGGIWVGRLFAYEPTFRLGERLHLVPIPASIPRNRWLRTTIRIQHLGSSSLERNQARYDKYREADPEGHRFGDYEHLLEDNAPPVAWEPRSPDLPVLLDSAPVRRSEEAFDVDLDAPLLTAVVISRDDEETIERTVRSVVEQECPAPFEVIVVTSGTDRTAQIVRDNFPHVTVIELPVPALPGAARNVGLRAARGDYVSFPGSHVELPPGSLAARMRAHQLGFPMVTGSILNGTQTSAGWASYFLDHSGALPGRPSGELTGPPAHCSYDREILLDAGGFPEDMRAGEDTVVNVRLNRRGYRAYREQQVSLVHRSPCRTLVRLIRHHFSRGRAWGRILIAEARGYGSLLGYVPRRMESTTLNVAEWGGDLEATYRRVRPLVAAGIVAAWLGACFEITLGRLVRRRPIAVPVTSPTSARYSHEPDAPETCRSPSVPGGK